MFTFFQLSLILLLNNVLCAPVPVLHTETTETQNIVTQYESGSTAALEVNQRSRVWRAQWPQDGKGYDVRQASSVLTKSAARWVDFVTLYPTFENALKFVETWGTSFLVQAEFGGINKLQMFFSQESEAKNSFEKVNGLKETLIGSSSSSSGQVDAMSILSNSSISTKSTKSLREGLCQCAENVCNTDWAALNVPSLVDYELYGIQKLFPVSVRPIVTQALYSHVMCKGKGKYIASSYPELVDRATNNPGGSCDCDDDAPACGCDTVAYNAEVTLVRAQVNAFNAVERACADAIAAPVLTKGRTIAGAKLFTPAVCDPAWAGVSAANWTQETCESFTPTTDVLAAYMLLPTSSSSFDQAAVQSALAFLPINQSSVTKLLSSLTTPTATFNQLRALNVEPATCQGYLAARTAVQQRVQLALKSRLAPFAATCPSPGITLEPRLDAPVTELLYDAARTAALCADNARFYNGECHCPAEDETCYGNCALSPSKCKRGDKCDMQTGVCTAAPEIVCAQLQCQTCTLNAGGGADCVPKVNHGGRTIYKVNCHAQRMRVRSDGLACVPCGAQAYLNTASNTCIDCPDRHLHGGFLPGPAGCRPYGSGTGVFGCGIRISGGECAPRCGNGVLDPGESCESEIDGVRADYPCPTCKLCDPILAPIINGTCSSRCGDGLRNSPLEQCDGVANCGGDCRCLPGFQRNTTSNSANTCTPLCGNGIINDAEECDGTAGCTAQCRCDAPGHIVDPSRAGRCIEACTATSTLKPVLTPTLEIFGRGKECNTVTASTDQPCSECLCAVSHKPTGSGACEPRCGNGVVEQVYRFGSGDYKANSTQCQRYASAVGTGTTCSETAPCALKDAVQANTVVCMYPGVYSHEKDAFATIENVTLKPLYRLSKEDSPNAAFVGDYYREQCDGIANCSDQCQCKDGFKLDVDECVAIDTTPASTSTILGTCGDGIVDSNEQCDDETSCCTDCVRDNDCYARVQEELRGLLNAEYRIDTSNLAAGVLVAADASDLESVKIHHKVAGGNVAFSTARVVLGKKISTDGSWTSGTLDFTVTSGDGTGKVEPTPAPDGDGPSTQTTVVAEDGTTSVTRMRISGAGRLSAWTSGVGASLAAARACEGGVCRAVSLAGLLLSLRGAAVDAAAVSFPDGAVIGEHDLLLLVPKGVTLDSLDVTLTGTGRLHGVYDDIQSSVRMVRERGLSVSVERDCDDDNGGCGTNAKCEAGKCVCNTEDGYRLDADDLYGDLCVRAVKPANEKAVEFLGVANMAQTFDVASGLFRFGRALFDFTYNAAQTSQSVVQGIKDQVYYYPDQLTVRADGQCRVETEEVRYQYARGLTTNSAQLERAGFEDVLDVVGSFSEGDCSVNNGGCGTLSCIKAGDTSVIICGCPSGAFVGADGATCVKEGSIDCTVNNGGCAFQCELSDAGNNVMQGKCVCDEDYVLVDDYDCRRKTPCDVEDPVTGLKPCEPGHKCEVVGDDYQCSCNVSYNCNLKSACYRLCDNNHACCQVIYASEEYLDAPLAYGFRENLERTSKPIFIQRHLINSYRFNGDEAFVIPEGFGFDIQAKCETQEVSTSTSTHSVTDLSREMLQSEKQSFEAKVSVKGSSGGKPGSKVTTTSMDGDKTVANQTLTPPSSGAKGAIGLSGGFSKEKSASVKSRFTSSAGESLVISTASIKSKWALLTVPPFDPTVPLDPAVFDRDFIRAVATLTAAIAATPPTESGPASDDELQLIAQADRFFSDYGFLVVMAGWIGGVRTVETVTTGKSFNSAVSRQTTFSQATCFNLGISGETPTSPSVSAEANYENCRTTAGNTNSNMGAGNTDGTLDSTVISEGSFQPNCNGGSGLSSLTLVEAKWSISIALLFPKEAIDRVDAMIMSYRFCNGAGRAVGLTPDTNLLNTAPTTADARRCECYDGTDACSELLVPGVFLADDPESTGTGRSLYTFTVLWSNTQAFIGHNVVDYELQIRYTNSKRSAYPTSAWHDVPFRTQGGVVHFLTSDFVVPTVTVQYKHANIDVVKGTMGMAFKTSVHYLDFEVRVRSVAEGVNGLIYSEWASVTAVAGCKFPSTAEIVSFAETYVQQTNENRGNSFMRKKGLLFSMESAELYLGFEKRYSLPEYQPMVGTPRKDTFGTITGQIQLLDEPFRSYAADKSADAIARCRNYPLIWEYSPNLAEHSAFQCTFPDYFKNFEFDASCSPSSFA